jgi:hypothetical protein
MHLARLLLRAANVKIAGLVGIDQFQMYVMASTKRKIKKGDLLPWFLEDHATLPAWYLKDCQKFFDWLKLDHKQRQKLN